MIHIALASSDHRLAAEMEAQLARGEYRPWRADPATPLVSQLSGSATDVLLLDFGDDPAKAQLLVQAIKNDADLRREPILAMVNACDLFELDCTVGFEDFIVRGRSLREIDLRIRLVLWRSQDSRGVETLQAGPLALDLASYQITMEGRPVHLTHTEFQLLHLLLSQRGKVFSRTALVRHLWGPNYRGGIRTVDVHIRRLRGKLGPHFNSLIQTVRNAGYRMPEQLG